MSDNHSTGASHNIFTAYVAAKLDAVAHRKSEAQIGKEIGYQGPQIIGMFRTGEARVPLDKVVPLAKAIDADPAYLAYLWLKQCVPDVAELLRPVMSGNEDRIPRAIE